MRARRFANLGLVHLLDASALSPAALAETIDLADSRPPGACEVDLDGAGATARILASMAAAGRTGAA
jgi:predicted glycosyltransferase